MSEKSFLFVGGMPRSGTSALRALLTLHPDTMIGQERYKRLWNKTGIDPSHFEKDRFLDVTLEDTAEKQQDAFSPREEWASRYDNAWIVGDKIPPIYRVYDMLWSNFPGCRVLYIVRNPISVAESFDARVANPDDKWSMTGESALRGWNMSVRKTLDAVEAGRPVTVLSYERFFGSAANADRLFEHLGLDPARADRRAVKKLFDRSQQVLAKPVVRDDEMRLQIMLQANIGVYRKLVGSHCQFADIAETPQTAA
ncbi:MAG: sulfotransferase [Pseudomonadota bacterium]